MKKNRKVPIAVLGCFLVAFVLQGVLKLNGVFVFEKSLDWDIFRLIDSAKWSQIIYYTIVMFATMYCLSFALTRKCYSKKWYHYVIMAVVSIGVTILRLEVTTLSYPIQILLDIIAYIGVPMTIYFTTNISDRLMGKDIFGVFVVIIMQIMLYFGYLGLNYWSALLSSFIITNPIYMTSSAHFLIELEIYIGLFIQMLSLNVLVDYIKGDKDMILPTNIASEKAMEEEIKRIEK